MELKKMKKEQLLEECLRKDATIADLSNALDNKTNHVHRLNSMLDDCKNTTAQFRAKCTELSKNIVGLENKTSKLSKDVSVLVKEKDTLSKKNKEYLNLVGKYKADVEHYVQTIKDLQERNDNLEDDFNDLQQEVTKYKTLDVKLKDLANENKTLVEALNDCAIERSKYERKIEQLMEYKITAERTIENQKNDYAHLTDLYDNVFNENINNRRKVYQFKNRITIISTAYVLSIIIAVSAILLLV